MTDKNENYTEEEKFLAERPRKRIRRSFGAGYIYLFIFAFAIAFFAMKKMVESYSPDVDVQIGNKEEITLNDDDMNFEARTIDERLKWIQSEDDIPVAGKNGKSKDDMTWKRFTTNETIDQKTIPVENKRTDENEFKNIPVVHENEKSIKLPVKETKNVVSEDNNERKKDVVVKDEKQDKTQQDKSSDKDISISITRVYAGSYATFEEAAAAQKKLSETDPTTAPFIKNKNGKYTLQAGSFYDPDKADALVKKLNASGFQANKVTDK